MVSATLREEGTFAEIDYENPELVDPWPFYFNKLL